LTLAIKFASLIHVSSLLLIITGYVSELTEPIYLEQKYLLLMCSKVCRIALHFLQQLHKPVSVNHHYVKITETSRMHL